MPTSTAIRHLLLLWASSEQLRCQLVGHLGLLLDLHARPLNGLGGLQSFLRVDLGSLPISDARLVDERGEQLLAQAPRAALAAVHSGVFGQVADQGEQATEGQFAGEDAAKARPVVVLEVGLDLAGLLRDQEGEAEDSPVVKP